MDTGHRGPLLSGAGAPWGRGNRRRPEALDALWGKQLQAASFEHIASVQGGLCFVAVAIWVWIFFSSPPAVGDFFFFRPAFISSPLSACDVSPLLTIRRVMGVPCTFPPSSCITQVFWRDFQSPGAFSPPQDDACKEGKGCCHHLPGSRICLLGPKTKASCCGQKCCF